MSKKLTIFWHISQLEHWVEVVKDQLITLRTSGLLERCDYIYVGFLGEKIKINWLLEESTKISIIAHDSFFKHYERLTINALVDYCNGKNNPTNEWQEEYILYIHSKGLTRGRTNNNVNKWRKFMEYFLIENFEKVLPFLEHFDVVGCNAINHGTLKSKVHDESHHIHFSGNFWWSKKSFLKNQKKLSEQNKNFQKDYWLCERWICYKLPLCKILELCHCGHNNYYTKTAADALVNLENKWKPMAITFTNKMIKSRADEMIAQLTKEAKNKLQ